MEKGRTMRKCPWCNEQIRERTDARLAVHRWEVGWDRERGRPIMERCIGSATTLADAIQAGYRPPVIDHSDA